LILKMLEEMVGLEKEKERDNVFFLKKNRVYVVKSIFLILFVILISRRIIIANSIFLNSN
jgi:hypothetical protein